MPENIPRQSSDKDDLRRELEQKIEKIDSKVEAKTPLAIFLWAIALVVAAVSSAVLYMNGRINSLYDDRLPSVQKKVTILETQFKEHRESIRYSSEQ